MEKFVYRSPVDSNAAKIFGLMVMLGLLLMLQFAVNNNLLEVRQFESDGPDKHPIRISATPHVAQATPQPNVSQMDEFGNGRDHPFGWRGRINVPYPGGETGNVVITPVNICCDFDRCTNCDPVFGEYPTLVANPTFIPTSPPGLPTYVPTPVRDIPTRISTPVNQPPPTPNPNSAARPTADVLTPEEVVLTGERPPAPLSELDTNCIQFGNLECGPFWVPTSMPPNAAPPRIGNGFGSPRGGLR